MPVRLQLTLWIADLAMTGLLATFVWACAEGRARGGDDEGARIRLSRKRFTLSHVRRLLRGDPRPPLRAGTWVRVAPDHR